MKCLPLGGAQGGLLQVPGVDVLAVQGTHLTPVPLETAHTTVRIRGLRLHHGRPAAAAANKVWGRACGVGFLVNEAVAVEVALPKGAAWWRLNAMRWVHAERLAPCPGLPRGLLLVSIDAPQQAKELETQRVALAVHPLPGHAGTGVAAGRL